MQDKQESKFCLQKVLGDQFTPPPYIFFKDLFIFQDGSWMISMFV